MLIDQVPRRGVAKESLPLLAGIKALRSLLRPRDCSTNTPAFRVFSVIGSSVMVAGLGSANTFVTKNSINLFTRSESPRSGRRVFLIIFELLRRNFGENKPESFR